MEEELRSRFKEVLNFYNSNINQLANGESSTQVRLSRQLIRVHLLLMIQ